jgi:hypothetical protein
MRKRDWQIEITGKLAADPLAEHQLIIARDVVLGPNQYFNTAGLFRRQGRQFIFVAAGGL